MTRWLGVIAILIGCGGSSAPTAGAPRAASKCAHVADQLIELMTTTAKDAPIERVDRMRQVFLERCERDGWSAEAQACFLEVDSLRAAGERCDGKLTAAQRSAFGAAIEQEASAPSPGGTGGTAPPRPPRPPAPAPSSDPCEGGE